MTTSRMCWSWPTAVLARVLWTLLLFAPATLMVHAAVLHPSGGFQPSLGLGLDYGRLDGPVPALTADYNAGKEGCALVLTRSSLYDHTQSIFLGAGSGYGGNCITYAAVDHALAQALQYLRIETPEEEWMPEQLATVGEVFLETARILARRYGLTPHEIENQLPLLDTHKTNLLKYCPDFMSPLHCTPGKYRRFDGLCNNLQNPTWGARLTSFTRLLPPAYNDGISEPRIGYGGLPLPGARSVTSLVHIEETLNDHAATTLVVSWGQFMDHDFTLTGTMLNPLDRNEFEECCRPPPGSPPNKYCFNIDVPANDAFFSRFGVRCIDFVRGFPGVRHGCRLGSRTQFNLLTATIDANTVYGVRESFARSLRSGYGGHLRMNPVLRPLGLMDLLPAKTDIPDEGCTHRAENGNKFCFDGGEIRVNEQLILTCMHTLWAREHNRIATQLYVINPHWDDEILFQEARNIVIAMIQHITYNEFLPVVLGKDMIAKFNLVLQKEGYWNGYDPTVNPGIMASFAAAAFRFGHTILPTNVERWSKAHRYVTHTPLSDLIRQPYQLYEPGVLDEYYIGMINQPALAFDNFITAEVTTMLFRKPGERHGVDLTAFNLQRNREVGLPGYTEFRKFCGLSAVHTWEDLLGSMSNDTVYRYAATLRTPHDIDLWSGGVSERALPGSLLGPTFACVIATQFSSVRVGDRFWYELGNQPSSFTPAQLEEIRKSRLARVLCDNTDLIQTIQTYPLVLPDHEINPRVSCKSSIIPYMDLTKWAEPHNSHLPKTPTLVQPVPHGHPHASTGNPNKDGITVNEVAIHMLREALSSGVYAGQFTGPHRSPLYPHSGKIKPTPTRRPIVLSQEYIDTLNTHLIGAGFPGLNGLYNILTHVPNNLYKRTANSSDFFGDYAPYAPKQAAEYRTDMDEVVETAMHGPLNYKGKFFVNKFVAIEGPYGKFDLQDFVSLAEHLVKTSNQLPGASQAKETDAVNFDADSPSFLDNVGTANARTISSSSTSNVVKKPVIFPNTRKSNYRSRVRSGRSKRAESEPENVKGSAEVPIDLSQFSKPSRLDIFLPEYIVDHVEAHAATLKNKGHESNATSTSEDVDQVIKAEEIRAAEHKNIEVDIQKAVEAMKNLEDSYKVLYDQIEAARKLFPDSDDPAHKTLEDILSTASTPRYTLESETLATTDKS